MSPPDSEDGASNAAPLRSPGEVAIVRLDSRLGRHAVHDIAATRRIEQAAGAAAGAHALMRAAGAAVARLAVAVAPHARTTWILCGAGNNGGDGAEAALCLHQAGRRVVLVAAVASPATPADATDAWRRALAAGVPSPAFAKLEASVEAGDLVIDALLGIGGNRAPDGALATAIDRIAGWRSMGARVLSIDVPSGLDADHGQPFAAACVSADDTLALLTVKPGLVTAAGGDHVGQLWLASLVAGPPLAGEPVAWLVGSADDTRAAKPRRSSQHKGSFGDVAVVGGAPTMRGAAWLAAAAAHAAGAGRVWVDLLGDAADAGATNFARPELMLRPGWVSGDVAALAAAVVVCGCGGGELVVAILPRLLAHARRLVLDADALNAVASDTSLQTLLAARRPRGLATVLTPHPREAGRLLGSDAITVQADRLGAAAALVERYGAVCVVKGAGSIVAAPGQRPRISRTGNARLATAGTGDVLAGWIGGRWAASGAVAGGDDPQRVAFDVATAAVIEHGAAAESSPGGAMRAAELVEALHIQAGR